DDEEEEDGEEEEDEEEEEEPTLKYSRLEGSAAQIFSKDTASAIAVCEKYIIVGSHNGMIFVLSPEGRLLNRFRPHSATINDLSIDSTGEYVGSASMDGLVSIQSLVSTENHTFDMRRPMRCIALDPNYVKRNTRQFVSGGMAGSLVLSEKGWLGQKDVTLYSGEGPIWAAEWRGTLIAWASDAGVRIYDTATSHRITYISRSDNSPRADLFKCTLRWQDDRTLLIAWADVIKVASVREREAKRSVPGLPSTTELYVEVTAILQVDCMISGIASYGPKGDLLVLAYTTEEDYDDETAGDRDAQRRKSANRPELRIISRDGEELSSDAISLRNYARFQCRDYSLEPTPARDGFLVVSPEDIVVAETRDEADHIAWLIETQRYDEALKEIERTEEGAGRGFDVTDVGKKYLDHLVGLGRYDKAASECPRILGINAKLWENWVFLFAEKGKLDTIIPYVPTHDPTLSRLVYEMILAHFLRHDPEALLKTTRSWPIDIYDIGAVTVAIRNQIEREPKSGTLMRAISELYLRNRQPGKALPYFLKLRDPHAFVLVRDYNLFTDIQDQALQLIEFDEELRRDGREKEVLEATSPHGIAIDLLVDHTHSIPIPRVISQLQDHRKYLYMYLDALFDKDAHLAFDYSDLQVDLYAEFKPEKLMDFLRASNYYSLERAYQICEARDLVPEMVFLLGRMGDNKRALTLIIERLGDVQRAIDFAREQNDTDLWEDLLKYCETKPRFIRGLLENVGVDVDPIRLIRRIQNGLEIPGLKPALIKILQDFQLQISLMDGCKSILYGDCRNLALSLHSGQTGGFLWT
ncbi:vacuolar protein sorting-associated protein 41, partial [Rhodotorula sp. JG-1b]